jgi:hypothetical protein
MSHQRAVRATNSQFDELKQEISELASRLDATFVPDDEKVESLRNAGNSGRTNGGRELDR